jgi:hypothetical protein
MVLESLLKPVRKIAHALTARVFNDRGDFTIKGIPLNVQLFKSGMRIGRLEQRAVAIISCALP